MSFQTISPISAGIKVLVAFILAFVLASCSKEETMDAGERVICISASGTRTYYAINETDGITYTTYGIVYLINRDIKQPKWILSYEEIAKRLDIPFTQVSTMNISRTKVLNDGLWRFTVQFGEQEGDIEHLIDVNPDTGSIEWVQSIEEMPGGEVTLQFNH